MLLYPVCGSILAAEDFLSLPFDVSLPSFQSLLCPPSSRKTSLTKVSHSLPSSWLLNPRVHVLYTVGSQALLTQIR